MDHNGVAGPSVGTNQGGRSRRRWGRRTWSIACACLVAAVAIGLVARRPVVTLDERTCARLVPGMTLQDVEAVIGGSAGFYDGLEGFTPLGGIGVRWPACAPSAERGQDVTVDARFLERAAPWILADRELLVEFSSSNPPRMLRATIAYGQGFNRSLPAFVLERITRIHPRPLVR